MGATFPITLQAKQTKDRSLDRKLRQKVDCENCSCIWIHWLFCSVFMLHLRIFPTLCASEASVMVDCVCIYRGFCDWHPSQTDTVILEAGDAGSQMCTLHLWSGYTHDSCTDWSTSNTKENLFIFILVLTLYQYQNFWHSYCMVPDNRETTAGPSRVSGFMIMESGRTAAGPGGGSALWKRDCSRG